MGNIIGFINVILDTNEALYTATCRNFCKVKSLPIRTVRLFMDNNPIFREKVYRNSMFHAIKIFPDRAGHLSSYEENTLNNFISNSRFFVLEVDEMVSLPFGGFLF